MEQAREAIRLRLSEVKTFLARETPPRLSESDTKANFIEPIIASLGWQGIGVVTREYYVRNSQEFIDYVMAGDSGPLLALEAKPLQTDLTDKHAAQLIQYCAVEGIEWAALTNGRELQFFNTFLKPDLAAKRVLRLDLLAFNNDSEFDALFSQVWQLSRESMTKPSGVRTWLNQRRLDTALRAILLDSSSTTNRQLRKALADSEISVTPQDLTTWFRVHLGPSVTTLPAPRRYESDRAPGQPTLSAVPDIIQDRTHREQRRKTITPEQIAFQDTFRKIVSQRLPEAKWRTTKYYDAAEAEGHTFLAVAIRRGRLVLGLTLSAETSSDRLTGNTGEFNWARMTKIAEVASEQDIDDELLSLIEAARSHAAVEPRSKAHYGVTLGDVVRSGFLAPGTALVLIGPGHREAAHARVSEFGAIEWNGTTYPSPSDRVFANLVGRSSLNGWTDWYAQMPHGREPLAAVRARFLESIRSNVNHDGTADASEAAEG